MKGQSAGETSVGRDARKSPWLLCFLAAFLVHAAVAAIPLGAASREKAAADAVEISLTMPSSSTEAGRAEEDEQARQVEKAVDGEPVALRENRRAPPSPPRPRSATPSPAAALSPDEPEPTGEEPVEEEPIPPALEHPPEEVSPENAASPEPDTPPAPAGPSSTSSSGQAPSAFPSSVSTTASRASRDTPSANDLEDDLLAYGRRLAQAISAQRRYPAMARRMGLQGVVRLHVELFSSGEVAGEPLVYNSSGSEILDAEAVRMVKAAAPFPRLPDGLEGRTARIPVPIVFELR